MKIRQGFVSNSSSSSFVLAYNGEVEDAQDKILELLGVPEDSLLYNFAVDCSKVFSSAEELDVEDPYFKEDKEKGWLSWEQEKALELREEYSVVLMGSVSNEGDGSAEDALVPMEFSHEDENFALHKHGYF